MPESHVNESDRSGSGPDRATPGSDTPEHGVSEPESALVRRARSDPEAFGELYEAYYSRILNYIYRSTMNRTVAEELTSNTFFKALRGIDSYVCRTAFRCWLYRIATNEVRMHWRKQKIRQFLFLGGADSGPEDAVYFAAPEVELAEEQRARLRRYGRLHELLSDLPVRYQAPLRLRFVEQLSLEEVAQVLGKPLGTVKSLVHRGLARLRAQVRQDATFQKDANYGSVEIERSL